MGVRTLNGEADGTTPAAAMYDSVTGRMLGDIWEGESPDVEIEAFIQWLHELRPIAAVQEGKLELDTGEIPDPRDDGTDPRHWPQAGLVKLSGYWRKNVRQAAVS